MNASTPPGGGSGQSSARRPCRDLDPLLASYVDGEASAQDRSTVDVHLDACPPCRDRVAGERAARAVLHARREALRNSASVALRSRCAALCARTGARSSTGAALRRRWVPLSLAATVLLAVAGVFLFGLSDRVDVFAAQLALDHVKCFKLTPDRLTTGEPAAIEQDWAGRQGWALKVPSSAPAQRLELLGIRRCGSTEGRVAHVMYRWRGEPLSVYILPGAIAAAASVQRILDSVGHQAVIWSHDGRTYAVVAHAPPGELAQVAAYVRGNAR